jgi:hypothetical protein
MVVPSSTVVPPPPLAPAVSDDPPKPARPLVTVMASLPLAQKDTMKRVPCPPLEMRPPPPPPLVIASVTRQPVAGGHHTPSSRKPLDTLTTLA